MSIMDQAIFTFHDERALRWFAKQMSLRWGGDRPSEVVRHIREMGGEFHPYSKGEAETAINIVNECPYPGIRRKVSRDKSRTRRGWF